LDCEDHRVTSKSEFQLVSALVHMTYELDMMVFSTQQLSHVIGAPDKVNVVLESALLHDRNLLVNVFLDSALLHTRNLAAFLIWPDNNPTSIRPSDFSADWTPSPTVAVENIEKIREPINKHLAHLTWQRDEQGKQGWDCVDIARDMVEILALWVDVLRQSHPDLVTDPRMQLDERIDKARAALAG
jgi:hypothetical protein